MNKVVEMRQKRAELWDKAKAFLDEHQNENGMMSAEDTAAYERMESDVVEMGRAIDRAERQDAMDREMNVADRVLTRQPERNDGNAMQGRASDEYRTVFWNSIRGIRNPYNALQVDTDAEGGYLVPDEFENTLVQALNDNNVVRNLATVIRTSSGDRKIPIVAAHGTADWIEEEGAYQESDETFGQITLGAHKLGTMIKVSDELLHDSAFNLETYLANEFGRRIGAAEETAFLTGNGSHKPYGLTNATYGAGTGVTTASATAFTADELLDLVYSLRGVYHPKAQFIMNQSTIKALRKLKDGSGQYLWQPGLKEGEPDRLLSYRINTSAAMDELGAGKKPILFGDFSYYWIADRETRTFRRLNELYAANGQVGFRGSERVDGRLILTEAVKAMVCHA